jgi:uncharacterized membrane protein YcaP (DUF421 family)
MFFDNWTSLLRIIAVGIPVYAVVVLLLRLTGKRALAKMNAFDLVVTVALGSTLATTLLSERVALAEGLFALGLLLGMQYLVAWASLKWPKFREAVVQQPRLLLHNGRLLDDELRKERIAREEVLAAVRASGHMSLSDVAAAVLETDGSFSIMARQSGGEPSAMESVANFPPDRECES